eukprot:GHVS01007742.1.p1 GENE.GHVS01007742.1~~GHVS01007742.1.p1  ORF type:complete len:190 (+),score=46.42 GHVS01007742.1:178-747(+)
MFVSRNYIFREQLPPLCQSRLFAKPIFQQHFAKSSPSSLDRGNHHHQEHNCTNWFTTTSICCMASSHPPSYTPTNLTNSATATTSSSSSSSFHRANFEVFGRVQGVFFRVHAQRTARELGLAGWVRNTRGGTVEGLVEGPTDKLDEMLRWLRQVGSPNSRIDKCIVKSYKQLAQTDLSEQHDFAVVRTT